MIAVTNVLSGLSSTSVASISDGFTGILRSKLLASDRNLALTDQVVMRTTDGKVQIASCSDGNIVEVFLDASQKDSNIVIDRLFMSKGEVQVVSGVQAGSIITSTKGITGASGCIGSSGVSPMPLAPGGFAGKQFYCFAFRNSNGGGSNEGRVFVANASAKSTVGLYSSGALVEEVNIEPNGYYAFATNNNLEFEIRATQPVFCAIGASIGVGEYDLRLVPPLSTTLIGWNRNARLSALYPNTEVFIYRQNGDVRRYIVNPGSPISIYTTNDADGSGNAGNTAQYAADGCLILQANGPISCFSGADGSGLEATAFYPLDSLGQIVPLPLGFDGTENRADRQGITVASDLEGTAIVYNSNGSVYATLNLVRGGTAASPVTNTDQQRHPAAATIVGTANGVFSGGWVEADVPIYVVFNSENNQTVITDGISTDDDEIVFIGSTDNDTRSEIRKDLNGFRRLRVIDASGNETWEIR